MGECENSICCLLFAHILLYYHQVSVVILAYLVTSRWYLFAFAYIFTDKNSDKNRKMSADVMCLLKMVYTLYCAFRDHIIL